jgi:hypothetical protein
LLPTWSRLSSPSWCWVGVGWDGHDASVHQCISASVHQCISASVHHQCLHLVSTRLGGIHSDARARARTRGHARVALPGREVVVVQGAVGWSAGWGIGACDASVHVGTRVVAYLCTDKRARALRALWLVAMRMSTHGAQLTSTWPRTTPTTCHRGRRRPWSSFHERL